MDVRDEAAELRKQVLARSERSRFSLELASRICAHVAVRRAAGATMQQLASELGVALDTLYRWRREQPRGAALRRVEIVGERHALTVHGPCGVRIEGLDLDGVAALLRKLA